MASFLSSNQLKCRIGLPIPSGLYAYIWHHLHGSHLTKCACLRKCLGTHRRLLVLNWKGTWSQRAIGTGILAKGGSSAKAAQHRC